MFRKKVYIDWEEYSVKDKDVEFWGILDKLARIEMGEVV
jgi:hypothetical protein